MPIKVQNRLSLAVHLLILVLAICITDLGSVFQFAGTVGSSFISFFFPAVCYLILVKRNGTERMRLRWSTTMYKTIAWVFLFIGTMAVVTYIVGVTLKIMGKVPEEASSH